MSLVYSEEQRLLADTASEFLAARSPVSAQRRLRDEGSAEGFDPALWQEMVNLGWSAIPFPESLGGLEFGCKGLGAVFEQIGSKLGAAPLLSSVVLGGSVLELAGSAAQQSEWLPALIAGERRVALALDEQPRHDPAGTALAARRDGEGWVLDGDKVCVTDGLGVDAPVAQHRQGEADVRSGRDGAAPVVDDQPGVEAGGRQQEAGDELAGAGGVDGGLAPGPRAGAADRDGQRVALDLDPRLAQAVEEGGDGSHFGLPVAGERGDAVGQGGQGRDEAHDGPGQADVHRAGGEPGGGRDGDRGVRVVGAADAQRP